MGKAKLTTLIQGGTPTFTALWSDDKPGGSEGAVCNVLNSAFAPLIFTEKWMFHDGMWLFVPPDEALM